MNTYLKIYDKLFTTNLNLEETLIVSFIYNHYENNQDFFYTNEQILKKFGNNFNNIRKIQRILTSIETKGYITRITNKQHYKENNKWSNRRIIIPTQKLLDLINTPTEKEVVNNTPKKEKMETQRNEKSIVKLLKEKEEQLKISKIHQTNEQKIKNKEELPTPKISDYKEEIEVADELPTNEVETITEVNYINDMGINNEPKEFEEDDVYKNKINELIKEKYPNENIDTIDESEIYSITYDATLIAFFLRYKENLIEC